MTLGAPTRASVARERGDHRLTRVQESLRTGLWFVPGLFVVAAAVAAAVTGLVDRHVGASPSWLFFDGGATSAQQILTTIAASMITVTSLVFTITVVVLQLASSQFSPRVLRTFLRDRGSQVPLGVFAATFIYALFVLIQVRTGAVGPAFVPRVSVSVAFVLVVTSMVALIYFVNHVAQSIRVVTIIESVAAETHRSIDALFRDAPGAGADAVLPQLGAPTQTIRLGRRGGVVAGLDIDGLVEVARDHGCVLRLIPSAGDFVVEQAPLFDVYGGDGTLSYEKLEPFVDIGRERSLRQDPSYGFRLLADIAEKALSPALNDPTTAVQAIDRLNDLLGHVSRRHRPSGCSTDDQGELRLVRHIVSWDALVTLAFEEIREYGASSMQVHRRLRAAIEQLLDMVPADQHAPLDRQLRLLKHSEARAFADREERALAAEADDSGIGGED